MSPTISSKSLPPSESATFTDSSFFSRNGPGAQLPSPAEARERSARQPKWTRKSHLTHPARFEELGLVKFGRAPRLTVGEGECLWALRLALPDFPVPEVYGWTQNDGQVFIYMELVQGVTLEDKWGTLDRAERTDICAHLRALVTKLRALRHAPDDDFFLGHVNREPFGDIIFVDNEDRDPAGPFQSVFEFPEWWSLESRKGAKAHWPGKQH